MKRDYHPTVRKYAGCLVYAPARCITQSLPRYFLAGRPSFFRASKVEQTCSLADTSRVERERGRVKLVSTSCGSFLAQHRICMETNRLLLRLERVNGSADASSAITNYSNSNGLRSIIVNNNYNISLFIFWFLICIGC